MNLPRAAALGLCACLACDGSDPVAPFQAQGEGELLPLNRLIEDVIDSGVVHRYSFNVAADSEYVVLMKSSHGFVGFDISDPLTGAQLANGGAAPGPTPLEENPSDHFSRPQNSFVLIESFVIFGDSGRFQFKIVPVHTRPERAAAQIEFGDSIVGETIDPLYDTDVFVAHGVADQVAAAIEPLGSDSGAMILFLEDHNHQMLGQVQATAGRPLLSTGPIALGSTEDYRLVVRTWNYPRPHRGAYRAWTYRINPAPEHAAALLSANVVVSNERIDYPNDVDEFSFQDTVGAEYLAFLDARRRFGLFVTSPTDSFLVARIGGGTDTTLLHQGTVLFQLNSAGTHKVQVKGGVPGEWLVGDTGAYRFLLYRVDRRPESVAATFQVGDTIRGEEIYPAGEIDEFTTTATPGAQLRAGLRVTADPVPQFNYVELQVVDDVTGTRLAQLQMQATGAFQTGSFTVPASGLLRVRLGRQVCCLAGRAPYEFFLAP